MEDMKMLRLLSFNLQNSEEWEKFYEIFSAYLEEVCDEEEYKENIDDLHNEKLNNQMIEQTQQRHIPYFVRQIVLDETVVGLISYSYNEEKNLGFINNFYIYPKHRNAGIGTSAYMMAETHLKELGSAHIELIPVCKAKQFYIRNGFDVFRAADDGEWIYRKTIN
ncbi:MAG: GNAT family N-acetyltransferase [Ruminiclostridium sp.]|nr:GNAT family N-acetyltransferase [Ruminiclostridium sp.]